MSLVATSPQLYLMRAQLISQLREQDASPADWYRMLEAYYFANGLYEQLQMWLYENRIWTPGMKPLRNPASRVVEFHVTHLWPGPLDKALPIVANNKQIIEPIQQVWKWSNWGRKKQLAARWYSMFGDWFCKVATRSRLVSFTPEGEEVRKIERVFLQNIKPEVVTDFDVDERGFVTFMRLDIPQEDNVMHTEVWSKGGYWLYIHKKSAGEDLDKLPPPSEYRPLSAFGIDFVPFVHAPFMDVGEKRGVGSYVLALDKIDEANRMATRLHQLIFRFGKPTKALLANGNDPTGRPLPPVKLSNQSDDGKSEEHDDDVVSMPGTSKVEYLIANINYDAHLKAIDSQLRELEEDLPELSYYRLKDFGANISGRAARTLLSHAIDRALEARGNIEDALVRANMMALTIGAKAGLFKNIGDYENGDFEHTFAERDVIAPSAFEDAETIKTETGAGVPLVTAARRRGWSDAELEQMAKDKQAERDQEQLSLAQALLEAERRRDQNLDTGKTDA